MTGTQRVGVAGERFAGVDREGFVLHLAEGDAQRAAHRVAWIRGADVGEGGDQGAVVRTREVGEVEEGRRHPAHRLGREDPGAGVGGPAGVVPVDDDDPVTVARELVRGGGTDEAAAHHHHVRSLRHHDDPLSSSDVDAVTSTTGMPVLLPWEVRER